MNKLQSVTTGMRETHPDQRERRMDARDAHMSPTRDRSSEPEEKEEGNVGVRVRPSVSTFDRFSSTLLLVLIFLLPLFFIPSSSANFTFGKMLFVSIGTSLAFIVWLVGRLRAGTLSVPRSSLPFLVFLLPCSFLLAAFFSDAPAVSFFGNAFEPGTVFFLALAAIIFFLSAELLQTRSRIFSVYGAIVIAFAAIALFQASRLFFGYDTLSFGIFTSSIANFVGKWNDLAIFAGFVAILTLVSLESLSLSSVSRAVGFVVLAAALGLLAVVNFRTAWIILACTTAAFAAVSLRVWSSKDKEKASGISEVRRRIGVTTAVVFAVAVLFVVIGQPIGERIAQTFDISHLEARPSFASTLAVARDVFDGTGGVFFGAGPNRFVQPWLLAKPEALNLTPFWGVDFNFGVGLLPTLIITTGLVGTFAMFLFLGIFAKQGIGALFRRREDPGHTFLITSSVLGAFFLWAFSFVYVPNVVIILLTFVMTGVAAGAIAGERGTSYIIPFGSSKFGFVASLFMMLLIGAGIWGGVLATQRFTGAVHYERSSFALVSGDIETAVAEANAAVSSARIDRHYRLLAQAEVGRLREIVANVPSDGEPTEAMRSDFRATLERAVEAARTATEIDPNNYENWTVRGAVYGILVPLGVDGAYENAVEAYNRALAINPKNPAIHLALGRVAADTEDYDTARGHVGRAVELKGNYTQAVFFLSQLEVRAGNLEAAKQSAQAAAELAPNDPVAFFQLGLLRYNDEEYAGAIEALARAVALNESYANARYFLGLSLAYTGSSSEAIAQFERIRELNPDNEEVRQILANLESGQPPFVNDEEEEVPPEDREELPIEEE